MKIKLDPQESIFQKNEFFTNLKIIIHGSLFELNFYNENNFGIKKKMMKIKNDEKKEYEIILNSKKFLKSIKFLKKGIFKIKIFQKMNIFYFSIIGINSEITLKILKLKQNILKNEIKISSKNFSWFKEEENYNFKFPLELDEGKILLNQNRIKLILQNSINEKILKIFLLKKKIFYKMEIKLETIHIHQLFSILNEKGKKGCGVRNEKLYFLIKKNNEKILYSLE